MSVRTKIQVDHPTLQGFLNNHHALDILFLVESGSAIWGMKTEKSDTDFFGIYLPSADDLLVENVRHVISQETSKTKNTPADVDIKVYSLHHFLRNVLKGDSDTVSILFAPQNQVLYSDPRMALVKAFRSRLINQKIISSDKGGAYRRHQEFLKVGDPKFIYHAVRFLWISLELIKHRKLRLPVSPMIRETFLSIKQEPELGIRIYDQLTRELELLGSYNKLPVISSKVTEAIILGLYRASNEIL